MVAGRPTRDSSGASSLTSFIPRQVMLDSKASSASPPRTEGGAKKKAKNKDERRDMKEPKISRIRSIAASLETEGFNETLSVFQSEVQLQLLGCKRGFLDLEDILTKYLNSSEVSKKDDIDRQKEQDNPNCIQSLKVVGEVVSDTHENHIHKKKRKKSRGIDVASTDPNEPGIDGIANVVESVECLIESKTKKKKKSSMCSTVSEDSDMLAEAENRHVFVEEKLNNLKSLMQNNPVLLETPDVKPKEKKKMKKKNMASDILVDVIEPVASEEYKETPKKISACDKTVANFQVSEHAKDPLTGTEHKSKGQKKRKNLSSTEASAINGSEQLEENQEGKNKIDSNGKDSKVTVNNAQNIKLKKRKGNDSEENVSTNISIVAQEQINGQHNNVKEHEEKLSDCNALKDTSIHEQSNEKYEKNNEGFFSSTSEKAQRKNSDEPKSVNAFQRVKIDEVKFADERLQDNSYWAKDGADIGYGAKAQEILGQVRGRDFRHEKTKKKRGSYRGGQIDMQSHSIKFSYSEEDE